MKNFKKKKIILFFILIILGLIIYFIFNNISFEKINENNLSNYTPAEEITDTQLRNTSITLYFPSTETNELKSEGKLIDSKILLENPYKQIVQCLIDGPTSENLKKIIPDNTRILEATLSNRCVTLNFSEELLNFNSEDEKYILINSILNSLSQLNEVSSIKFLINGEINEKLNEEYAVIS